MSAKAQGFEVIKNRGGHSQLIGYARVSTADQKLAAQLEQLRKAGCGRVYAEKISGASRGPRPGFNAAREALRPDDTLVVTQLDRLGRRIVEVINVAAELTAEGIYIRSLAQQLDTRSREGRAILPIWAWLAETNLELIRELTRAGLAQARAEGRIGGRPSVITPELMGQAFALAGQKYSMRSIARALHVSEATVRKVLGQRPDDGRQLRLLDEPAATLEQQHAGASQ